MSTYLKETDMGILVCVKTDADVPSRGIRDDLDQFITKPE